MPKRRRSEAGRESASLRTLDFTITSNTGYNIAIFWQHVKKNLKKTALPPPAPQVQLRIAVADRRNFAERTAAKASTDYRRKQCREIIEKSRSI
jgi:hypothetical protein